MHLLEEDKAEFLSLYPGMRIAPAREGFRVYEGEFRFFGESGGWGGFEDSYQLRIEVPLNARDLPLVWETAGRVARIDPSHINPSSAGALSGTLCLGSDLRLRIEAGSPSTLVQFANRCIAPYLYAMSVRERGAPPFVFGELAHGAAGLLQDYEGLLEIRGLGRVVYALQLAAQRRRIANKRRCPCGCGKRLGRCELGQRINRLRKLVPRSYLASLTDGHQLIHPVMKA